MKEDIKNIRVDILEVVYKAHEGHIPSSFSIVELLCVIYAGMGKDDSFFLSKGHASAGLFAVLAYFGIIDRSELNDYAKYNSKLGGHPHRFAKGVMASTGSLGHGFPTAAGYALAKKIKNEKGTVFCIVGDGETNESTIWETATYAEGLEKYYEIGKEAVFYEGIPDLAKKIRYYLEHDEEREAIAEAGYRRTIKGHIISRRLEDIFTTIGIKK